MVLVLFVILCLFMVGVMFLNLSSLMGVLTMLLVFMLLVLVKVLASRHNLIGVRQRDRRPRNVPTLMVTDVMNGSRKLRVVEHHLTVLKAHVTFRAREFLAQAVASSVGERRT